MRQLTARQKKLLDGWVISYAKEGHELLSYDDLYNLDWKTLEQINDTEILWSEVNRYLSDKNMEKIYGNRN